MEAVRGALRRARYALVDAVRDNRGAIYSTIAAAAGGAAQSHDPIKITLLGVGGALGYLAARELQRDKHNRGDPGDDRYDITWNTWFHGPLFSM